MYSIAVFDKDGNRLAGAEGAHSASLLYKGEYNEGDYAEITSDSEYLRVKIDACVETARVYVPDRKFTYVFPLAGDNLKAYAPGSFSGGLHLISAEADNSCEYRAISLNPLDQRREAGVYPHATANVETRGESVFAARNVIDGVTISDGHGQWPYHSWGIGTREDAWLKLEFGREVEIDAIDLDLRADFPHDAWWERGHMELSDGTAFDFELKGIAWAQRIMTGKHTVTQLVLSGLKKCDNPSPFPALKQLTVYGRDIGREKSNV